MKNRLVSGVFGLDMDAKAVDGNDADIVTGGQVKLAWLIPTLFHLQIVFVAFSQMTRLLET